MKRYILMILPLLACVELPTDDLGDATGDGVLEDADLPCDEAQPDLDDGRKCLDLDDRPVCVSPLGGAWVGTPTACKVEKLTASWPDVSAWDASTCAEGIEPGVPAGFDDVFCRTGPSSRTACWARQGNLLVVLEPPCVEPDGVEPECGPAPDNLVCSDGTCYREVDGAMMRVALACQLAGLDEVEPPAC